jgi:hypothetical protein
MKFKELIDKYDWDDVHPTLMQLYPGREKNIEGYKQVFEELRTLKPVETEMYIVIEDVFDEYDKEYYAHVSGKDGTLNKESDPEYFKDDEIGNQEVSYAIEFTDWAQWLAMDIDHESLLKYSELDIIAHCLWEMTFYGFTQEDIKKAIDEIDKSVEEARNNPSSLRKLVKSENGDEFFWEDSCVHDHDGHSFGDDGAHRCHGPIGGFGCNGGGGIDGDDGVAKVRELDSRIVLSCFALVGY